MCNGRFRIMLAHHRGRYKQSFAIAVLTLIALFVFFPPFEFKPYALQAEELELVELPNAVDYPEPPKDVPDPPQKIEPADNDIDVVEEVPETTFGNFEELSLVKPKRRDGPTGFIPFDQLPVPEFLARPVYPPLAREAGIEGTVYLKVLVGLDHRVRRAVVLRSDVTPAMECAAIDAALKCRYMPAKQRNVEVEVWVPIQITFRLN